MRVLFLCIEIKVARATFFSHYGPVNGNGMFLIATQRWLAGSDSL